MAFTSQQEFGLSGQFSWHVPSGSKFGYVSYVRACTLLAGSPTLKNVFLRQGLSQDLIVEIGNNTNLCTIK